MLLFWCIISLVIILVFVILSLPVFHRVKSHHDIAGYRKDKVVLLLVCIGCIFFALSYYLSSSKHKEVAQWLSTKQRAEQVKKQLKQFGSRKEVIVALRQRLDQLPKNAETAKGWYILGKLYIADNNVNAALNSFERATKLDPTDQEYSLGYATAKFILNKNKLDARSREDLKNIVQRSPNNSNAVNLLAMDDYQHENYDAAIHEWESLLKFYPADSNDAKSLLMMIHQAQDAKLKGKTKVAHTLVAEISISPAMKKLLKKSDTLFVYALSSEGSRIPLAVVRIQDVKLPLTVELSDKQAMMPQHTLSMAKEVVVEARVSKSGNALPGKGDLIGKTSVIKLAQPKQSLAIRIDKVL